MNILNKISKVKIQKIIPHAIIFMIINIVLLRINSKVYLDVQMNASKHIEPSKYQAKVTIILIFILVLYLSLILIYKLLEKYNGRLIKHLNFWYAKELYMVILATQIIWICIIYTRTYPCPYCDFGY